MRRRDFVKKAAVGAVAGGLVAGCGGASSENGAPNVQTRQNVRWRLASSFPRSLDTIYGVAETMAERLEALTDGRFQIRSYPGGELVPAFEVLSAVQEGTVQMGHSASYYFVGKNAALAFDACVPFGLTARQYNAWLYHGGGLDLLCGLFSDFNIVNLPGGNTGTQMGGWFRDPVNSLEDMQGLRMRIPGLGVRVMNRLGVNVQNIPGGEIYPALERGTIDATEWVGPYDDEKLGFHEVAKNYYYPGWWEPGPALTFYVNQRAWDGLSSDYREALAVACDAASVRMLASYDAKNPAAFERLLQKGVQARPFPPDVMQAALDASTAMLEEEATASPSFRQVYDAYTTFRTDSFRWFDTAEQAFAAFAFGRLSGQPAAG